MLLHAGPRRLKIQGCYGPQIPQVGRSILAGCTSSTSIARAVVKLPLQEAAAAVKGLKQGVHVDDVSQSVAAGHKCTAFRKIITAGDIFIQGVHARKIIFSGDILAKSVVLSSDEALAQQVKHHFYRRHSVRIEIANHTEELGIGRSALGGRTSKTMRKRFSKGLKRARRTRWMVEINSRATKLWKQGSRPMQEYGACYQLQRSAGSRAQKRGGLLARRQVCEGCQSRTCTGKGGRGGARCEAR